MPPVVLTRLSPQQVEVADREITAFSAFLYVMWNLKTPNYLVLQHEMPAASFVFGISGSPDTDLDGALHYVDGWHHAFADLGQNHRTTELVYSEDGTRMACLDYQILTLDEPFTLPDGSRLHPAPGRATRRCRLKTAHYVRMAGPQIAEWRISDKIGDFVGLLVEKTKSFAGE